MIRKLIYLMVTKPDITFVVGVLSRFMHQPKKTHWLAVIKVLTFTSTVVQEKGWCIGNIIMYTFLDTVIQDMLVIERI